VQIDYLY